MYAGASIMLYVKHVAIILSWVLLRLRLVQLAKTNFDNEKNNVSRRADLIAALKNHFHSEWIVLHYHEDHPQSHLSESREVTQLQVSLAERHIPVASVVVTTEHLTNSSSGKKYEVLHVILRSTQRSLSGLQQLLQIHHRPDARWLLFMDNPSSSADDALKDLNIQLDCEFLVAVESQEAVNLSEVYRVFHTRPLVTSAWGSWSAEGGLITPSRSLYLRRNDFQGIGFVAAGVHVAPRLYIKEDPKGGLQVSGLFADICFQLSVQLNFSLTIVHADGNGHGSLGKDGKWSGVIGMIRDGRANMSVVPMKISGSRAKAVDYTFPLFQNWLRIYIQTKMDSGSRWGIYTLPFSQSLWLSIGGCIVFVTCALVAMFVLLPSGEEYNVRDVLFWTWDCFCAQGVSSDIEKWSIRQVVCLTLTVAVVLHASYGANLTSYLAIKKHSLPFTDLLGLLQADSYGFGTQAHSAEFDSFQKGHGVMKDIYKKKISGKENELPTKSGAGFDIVCRKKYAFLTHEHNTRASLQSVPCDVSVIPGYSVRQTMSMVLPQGSPYRRVISHTLNKMMESGVYRRIYHHWMQPPFPKEPIPPRSIQFHDVLVLLLLCVAGSLLSGVTLAVEIFITRRRSIASSHKPCFSS